MPAIDDNGGRPGLPGSIYRGNGGSVAGSSNGSTAAGAKSQGTAIPGEGVYQQHQAYAERAYADAMNRLRMKELGIKQQYGFNDDGGVDGRNPYSIYHQLKQGQAQTLEGDREMALSRHLGSKGLGAQVADQSRYDMGVQDEGFQRDYLGRLGGVADERLDASRTFEEALMQARWNQIGSGIDNEEWTPTASEASVSAAKQRLLGAVTQPRGYLPAGPAAQKAAQAALRAAQKKKLSGAEAALAARSAALNVTYANQRRG